MMGQYTPKEVADTYATYLKLLDECQREAKVRLVSEVLQKNDSTTLFSIHTPPGPFANSYAHFTRHPDGSLTQNVHDPNIADPNTGDPWNLLSSAPTPIPPTNFVTLPSGIVMDRKTWEEMEKARAEELARQRVLWPQNRIQVRTVRQTQHHTTPFPHKPESEAKVVKEQLPVLAHRIATVTSVAPTPDDLFTTAGGHGHFGKFSVAVCRKGWDIHPAYPAPQWDCTCGFYALPPDLSPQDDLDGPGTVLLMVELTGKVIACEKGFRAEEQTVVEVQVNRCDCCPRQDGQPVKFNLQTNRTRCQDHRPNKRQRRTGKWITLDQLRDHLGLPVTVRDAPDPSLPIF